MAWSNITRLQFCRLIPKSGSSFSFQVSGYKFTVPGSSILSKPAERITKKLKNKYPCDF